VGSQLVDNFAADNHNDVAEVLHSSPVEGAVVAAGQDVVMEEPRVVAEEVVAKKSNFQYISKNKNSYNNKKKR
jgi:hypothetical protein